MRSTNVISLAAQITMIWPRIASYELAYKMQEHAPEAVDFSKEDSDTLELYGVNDSKTQDFGRRCLIARRLVERGVRCIQLYSGGAHNDDNWDAHGDLEVNHNRHAGATDKPIAALLKDLKRRGLLDSTLVVWGGEFGRQPTAEYAKGSGAIITPTASRCGWLAVESRAASMLARRTNWCCSR